MPDFQKGLCFYAAYVRTVARIDFDSLAFVDEQGDADCGAGFYCGGLQRRGDSVYLKVAAGSVENLKPDLVMEAFCQFLGIEPDSVKFQHHRLEMYTDRSEDGSLIPLEAMGVDMTGDEE